MSAVNGTTHRTSVGLILNLPGIWEVMRRTAGVITGLTLPGRESVRGGRGRWGGLRRRESGRSLDLHNASELLVAARPAAAPQGGSPMEKAITYLPRSRRRKSTHLGHPADLAEVLAFLPKLCREKPMIMAGENPGAAGCTGYRAL